MQSNPPVAHQRLFHTDSREMYGQFSPDGRWVLYTSKELKELQDYEIYISPFSRPSEKHQVSSGGGIRLRWRKDGKEVFYHTRSGQLLSAEVRISGDTIEVGAPHPLFGGIPAMDTHHVGPELVSGIKEMNRRLG